MTKHVIRSTGLRAKGILAYGALAAIVYLTFSSVPTGAKTPRHAVRTDAASNVGMADTSLHRAWHIEEGCSEGDCSYHHASGEPYFPQTAVVATPAGATFSVHHQIHGDPDVGGPLPEGCIFIFSPTLPGAADDIVGYDGVPEAIRTDFFGTVPTVNERVFSNPDGTFLLSIDTSAPSGTDLFPDRFLDSEDNPLLDICFSIGLEDSLDWAGAETVTAAVLELLKDGEVLIGDINITPLTIPWTGVFSVVVEDAAGLGINQVHLDILISKEVPPPTNDLCENATMLTNGTTAFSNVGAEFAPDGPDEPDDCNFEGSTQIGSDIWYEYTASCNGDLLVDACPSFFDTKLAVYPGCGTCPPLERPLGCNDDTDFCGPFGEQSRLTVPVSQGECYTVRIGGFPGLEQQGPGWLRVFCTPGACCEEGECTDGLNQTTCETAGGEWFAGGTCATVTCPAIPPPHDECGSAAVLTTGIPFEATTDGAGGSNESSCGGEADSADTWHSWIADCSGLATFNLCNAFFDTTLAVFDACGGNELACSDDECGLSDLQSRITMKVEEGATYYVRVAGFGGETGGETGDYTLIVDNCTEPTGACCLANLNQQCFAEVLEADCLAENGTYLGDGSHCGADMNGNFADDACETCMAATTIDHAHSQPMTGTVDARRPHPPESDTPRQGIGSQPDPVVVRLNPRIIGAEECFELCESVVDVDAGPNGIGGVTALGSGFYEIVLERPITSHGVTTIRYTGDDSFVEYVAHPANVNADGIADSADVVVLIDCCILGLCPPAYAEYSCDLDHSGNWAAPDIITAIDLLNGAGAFTPSDGTPLPTNEGACP